MDRPEYTEVIAIYDNGGRSFDRYHVITAFRSYDPGKNDFLGLSENPSHPQGFSQWGCIQVTSDMSHLGAEVDWYDLPENVQAHIIERLHDTNRQEH